MTPEHDDEPDLTPESVTTIRKVADVMGVLAGLLFLIAFGIGLSQDGEARFLFLGLGVLFLLFPLFMRKMIPADH